MVPVGCVSWMGRVSPRWELMRWDRKPVGYPLWRAGFEETKYVSKFDLTMRGAWS